MLSVRLVKPIPFCRKPFYWKSGEILWLIIAAGDQRLIKTLVERVQETILKDRTLKFWIADGGGKVVTTAATSN